MGQWLRMAERSVMFWIGDWLNYGEREYGETYSQALEATGYDYQTVADAKWVAGRIELSDRSESLSWTHHRAVAALDRDERNEWLATAENQRLSLRELRAAIKDSKLAALPSPTDRVDDLQKLIDAGRKFVCIYADPPWLYDNQGTRATNGTGTRKKDAAGGKYRRNKQLKCRGRSVTQRDAS